MNTGYRKIIRDLWHDKGRTLLVVLSITVGVFAVGMVSGMTELMPANMSSSFIKSNPAHITLGVGGFVNDDELRSLTRVPGVSGVEGVLRTTIRWRPNADTPWHDALFIVRDDYTNQQFDQVNLLYGQWPGDRDIVVEHNSIDYYDVPVGASIILSSGDRERTVQVNGAVHDLQVFTPQFGGDATFFASREMAQWFLGRRDFNRISAQLPTFTEESAEDVAQALKDRLQELGHGSGSPDIQDPSQHYLQETVNTVILILSVMAILSLTLGLFLVVNTINAIISQQISQIGVMKAVGAVTAQVVRLYLSGVFIYGFLALLISIPLGGLAAHAMTAALLNFLNIPVDTFRFSSPAVAQQFGTGLVVPVIAALWPIVGGARVTVRKAISTYGIGMDYGSSIFDRILARIRGLPRPMMLTLRNTFRRKARVILTQTTLTIAGLVFVMVLSLGDSLTHTIDTVVDTLGLDAALFFGASIRIDEAEALISTHPGVEIAEMWLFRGGTAKLDADDISGERISLRAVPADTQLYQAAVVRGRWLHVEDGHALVLNQNIASELGVTVGDTITIELGDETSKWTIVGTVFDLGSGQTASYVPRDIFLHQIGLVGRTSVAWMRTTQHDRAFQSNVANELRDMFEARGISIGRTLTGGEISESNQSQFNILLMLLLTMSGLIALVGSIGLAGTLSLNVLERRREIGVMRAIGASSRTVAALFVGEGLLLGMLAWVIAIPLSVPGGNLFALAIADALNFTIVYQFSWNGALIWLGIVITLSVLASALPAWRATRVSVRDSLAYE